MSTILRTWSLDETQQFHLNLPDNVYPAVNYQFAIIQDITKSQSDFNKGFRVPASEENIAFFGYMWDVNYVGTFDPKKKYRAILEVNTITVLEGFVQLMDVIVENGITTEFEVRMFGEGSNLSRSIGSKLLSDYDWSTYDHVFNLANIQTGMTDAGLSSGVIKYGMADFGLGMVYDGNDGYPDLADPTEPIYIWHFKPLIRIKEILDEIITDAGFTYTSAFLEGSIFEKYFLLLHQGGGAPVFPVEDDYYFKVGLTGNFSHPGTGAGVVPFDDESSPFVDVGGNFDTVNNKYDIPVDPLDIPALDNINGGYQFKVSLKITNSGGAFYAKYGFTGLGLFEFQVLAGTNTYTFFSPEGMYLTPYFYQVILDSDTAITVVQDDDETFFELVKGPVSYDGSTLEVGPNMPPNYRAVDLLQAVVKQHNMVIIPDKHNERHLTIEPYDDWIGGGAQLDWSNKMDHKKAYRITPLADLEKEEQLWTYKEGKDLASKYYVDQGRVYGRKLLLNPDNDFAKGEKKVEINVASTPCNAISGTAMIVPKLFTDDGKPAEPQARILYNGGNHVVNEFWIRTPASPTAVSQAVYNYFGHYSVPQPDITDRDINFGAETPLHVISGMPLNTLFKEYWEGFMRELYDSDSRMMTAYFNLTEKDLYHFAWNDEVWIKNSWWRVNRILGFIPGIQQSTKVELIKLNDLAIDRYCTLTVDAIALDGQVTFTDGTTGGQTGNQLCCEVNGYQWIDSECQAFVGGNGAVRQIGTRINILPRYRDIQREAIRAFSRRGARDTRGRNVSMHGDNPYAKYLNMMAHGHGIDAQGGFVHMQGRFDISEAASSARRFYIDEPNTETFEPDDGTTWLCEIQIIIAELDTAIVEHSTITYTAQMGKTRGSTYVKSGYTATKAAQGHRATYDLNIDVTSDTDKIYFYLSETDPDTIEDVFVVCRVHFLEMKNETL